MDDGSEAVKHRSLAKLMAAAGAEFDAADTTRDDACFCLYSSGSTGKPKGTVHIQSSLIETAEHVSSLTGDRFNLRF